MSDVTGTTKVRIILEPFIRTSSVPVFPGGGATGTGGYPGREFPDPDPEIPAGTDL